MKINIMTRTIGKNTNPDISLITNNIGNDHKGYRLGKRVKNRNMVSNTAKMAYIANIVRLDQINQKIFLYRAIDSRTHAENINNDTLIIWDTKGLSSPLGITKFNTFIYLVVSESPRLRNLLFSRCAICPTTSGLRSIVPNPVPTSMPNIWSNFAIWYVFILGIFMREYFMEYIIIKRGAQLYICRQGVEAKQKGIYFINGEKCLI